MAEWSNPIENLTFHRHANQNNATAKNKEIKQVGLQPNVKFPNWLMDSERSGSLFDEMISVHPRDQAEDENQTILIMAKSAPKNGLNSIYHRGLLALSAFTC